MKQITSLHLSNSQLRVLVISTKPEGLSLDVCKSFALPSQPPDLNELELSKHIPKTSSTVVITLGGGLFHIQRVPLEVASESDRKAQINWEASQVLIDSIDHYAIDFHPAGRIAFWTAIRKEITQTYTEYFTDLGFDTVTFMPEPLALYALCKHKQTHNNQGAIWLGKEWGSFVAQTNNALTTAETVFLHNQPHNESRNVAQIKQWIQGDLSAERRRPVFDHVLLCGETEPITSLSKPISEFKAPNIVPFRISDHLLQPPTDAPIDPESPTFALALGAALSQVT
ncbi:MAG: hypothetical protein ACI8V2_002123 [Candidatus Latescibacterota bacterium]|jgi:hypothetical protein